MAARPYGLTIRLLGRPRAEMTGAPAYRLRSRKSWALLAYLILHDAAPTRSQLAALLFADADDPLGALRWGLAEVRRCLGPAGSVDGDPVVLRLPPGTGLDVDVVARGSWAQAVETPDLDAELLDGLVVRGAPAFESWLLSERRRLAASAEAILHEAAVALLARGALERARGFAVRAAAMSPLDENHQALLIRLYRLAGDDAAAERQYAAFVVLLRDELGVEPGVGVRVALQERRRDPAPATTDVSVEAVIEAGGAAIAAGAIEAGVATLRSAVTLADAGRTTALRAQSRLVLGEALVHSLRGLDEEGLAHLHEALCLALDDGDDLTAGQVRAELGYVDFLRARYDRAELWLEEARAAAGGSTSLRAKAATYLGSVAADRADYAVADRLLAEGVRLARDVREPRREAFAHSMHGRIDLARGRLPEAEEHLSRAVELATSDHWLLFLPWPQALLGEVHLARRDVVRALLTLEQAFARACQLGDPCWEGIAARGLGLAAEAAGQTDRAFEGLLDARTRTNRLADPYVWLDVHILDALCELGRRHGRPETGQWAETMRDLASRTGMRELTARAMLHAAALGSPGDADAAALLAADIDNPELRVLVAAG